MTALASLGGGAPALAGTFVYVSNAEDGDIGIYSMQRDGALGKGRIGWRSSVSIDGGGMACCARSL